MQNGIKVVSGSKPPRIAMLVVLFLMLTVATSAALAAGLPLKTCSNGKTAYLCQGDILVADANAGASSSGRIVFIDPVTGNQTIVAEGPPYLTETTGVIFDPNDSQILAVDRDNGVIRVNPETGVQSQLTRGGINYPAEMLKDPFAVALDAAGNIYVADSGWRASLQTCGTGTCIVAQVDTPGQIVMINRTSGTPTVHVSGGNIVHPFGLTYDAANNALYASDMSAFTGQGAIFSVLQPGQQTVIWGPASANPVAAQVAPMGCPLGLAADGSNNTVLATVFAYPAMPPENVYGCVPPGVFRVGLGDGTPGSGFQAPGSVPAGWILPFGIAVEPNPFATVLVVDEGLNGIYRLTSAGNFLFGPVSNPSLCAPGPVSPCGGTPASANYLINPVGINIRLSDPTANVGNPPDPAPTVTITGQPAGSVPEGTAISLSSTATFTGTPTYAWTVNGTPSGSSSSLAFTPNDNGTYVVGVTITTAAGTGADSTSINVTNVAPGATINGAPASGLVGTPINLTSSVTDPGSADTAAGFTYVWSVTRNGNPFASGTASILSFTPNASGSYVVTLTAKDKDNATGTDSKTVNVVVLPPTVTINGAPASSPEGTAINLTSTVSGTGPFAYSWAVTKNGSPFASGSGTSLSFTPNNNGTYVASLSVTNSGGTGIASKSISATNVAPAITLTNGPLIPLPEPSSTTVSLNFTDPGATDAHTCLFAWDDGSSNTVAGSTGSGSCSLSHVFTAQGVYTVSVTVADADGGSAVGMWRYVVIYDPDAGSVNGNGEVNSPATSLRYMTLPGTAKFGFTAKYKKGISVPDGNTEFQVKINKFKFKSTTYDWLVVNGHKAQFKGSGTVKIHGQNHANDGDCEDEDHFVNVSGAFAFTLTAHDGSLTTDGKDKFRIKIVNKTTNEVVYDSMPGTGDDPDGFTPLVITKGKITIRKN